MGTNFIGSTGTYSLIKNGLQASNLRAKTISNNIANINTKGYKRFSVVFEDNIKDKEGISDLKLKQTDIRHFASDDTINNMSIVRDNSTSMKTDGNNIDLETEKVNQAANTLKYNALITLAGSKMTSLKTAIGSK